MNKNEKKIEKKALLKRVLLLEGVHPIAKEWIESQGYEVSYESYAFSKEDLSQKLKSFQAVGFRSKTLLTRDILEENSHLEVIGAFCRGTNHIDTQKANALGIPVFHSPYSNTRSVAELVLGVIIVLSRKLCDQNDKLHKGLWEKSYENCHEVRGKVLGIVGYGHIGSQVSVLAESMGLKVYYYDILSKLPLGNSISLGSLDELLSLSDFVTLHVPATSRTKDMIGRKQIEMMKKGSYLINMSRGSVVDIHALAEGLKENHLLGVAVDVFPKEPSRNKSPFSSELRGLKNVIMTPHIGGSTEEAQKVIGREVAEKITNYFAYGSTKEAVNFPQLEPSPLEAHHHRILNIHENVHGVLKDINSIVSDLSANIERQHLATDAEIGYVIMDVDKVISKDIFDRIKNLPTSLKTRILS